MASGIYDKSLAAMMRSEIDLINDAVSVILVTSAYSPALDADEFQSTIPAASFIDETPVTGKSISGTAFKAGPSTFTRAASGKVAVGAVVIKNTGYTSTSRLLAYVQITPLTTNGTDITLTWDTDGIFEL